MLILNQDRDTMAIYEYETDELEITMVIVNTRYMGISICLNGEQLATFDTYDEALEELIRIKTCEYPYYVMNGFSDYLECWKSINSYEEGEVLC